MENKDTITDKKILHQAKWLQLNLISFIDSKNKARTWESVDRTTKKGDVDGVDIIAILNKSNSEKFIVLVLQFRPPTNSMVLEFPAGLIDPNEDIEVCATRELKEETGYTVKKISHVSKSPLPLEPGLSSANAKYVVVQLNEEDIPPKQELEENEIIEVVLLPFNDQLYNNLQDFSSKRNCLITSQLYSFSLGLSFKSLNL